MVTRFMVRFFPALKFLLRYSKRGRTILWRPWPKRWTKGE